jgi:hypothetical protein
MMARLVADLTDVHLQRIDRPARKRPAPVRREDVVEFEL